MSTYTIYARNQTHHLTEQSGTVIRSTIELIEGMEFATALTLLEKKGWTVVPDIENPVNCFDFAGSRYELHWRNGKIVSLFRDDEEITWEQLPNALKGLL